MDTASGAPRDSAPRGVFVDAVTGKHYSDTSDQLLSKRRLTWHKHYGWTYDVWVDDPGRYALSGVNSRFSMQAIGKTICDNAVQLATTAPQQLAAAAQQQLARAGSQGMPWQQPLQQLGAALKQAASKGAGQGSSKVGDSTS